VLERMIAIGRELNVTLLEGMAPADLEATDRILTLLRARLKAALQRDGATAPDRDAKASGARNPTR
jgi:hypothetical protein